MRKAILLATACALIAAPALAKTAAPQTAAPQSESTTHTGSAPHARAATTSTTPLSTEKFVNDAAITNMFEIQAGQLAEQKAQAQEDKTFAQKMIEDHQKAGDQLRTLVDGNKVKAELPTALDSDHQKKLQRLQKLSGDRFDKAYDRMQKAGHRDAVKMFGNYAKSGDNPALKKWAHATLPTLRDHLRMARALKS